MWDHHHTGSPLSIFSITSAGGSASGVFAFAFIAQFQGFKAVLWGLMGVTGVLFLLLCIVLRETRHDVILRRRAERLRKETGNPKFDVPEEMRAQSPKQLMRVSLLRPFYFLFTEPVIIFCALYNGYLFGLTFLFNGAFGLVFGPMGLWL